MDDSTTERSPAVGTGDPTPQDTPAAVASRPAAVGVPRARVSALLAAAMLGIGVAAGAAIGPAPESSLAGSDALARRLPVLLATIAARERASAAAAAAPSASAPEAPPLETAPAPGNASTAAAPAARTSGSGTNAAAGAGASPESEGAGSGTSSSGATGKKLPAVRSVWMIQLSGTSFSTALSQPSAAPYIDAQAVPAGTLLSGSSALQGSALANDALLAEAAPAGGPPPLLHSIVQPPCPEGAAGASCAPETPGQLQAADAFLRETLATITGTPAYKEHGLVVVTFSTVAIATQQGLAVGTSSSTLTSQPPAGVLLLSPFVHAGAKPTTTFNPTSPRQSLEALLH
jgi:hypothetical protein